MSIKNTISNLRNELGDCKLIAVSKTKPNELILEAYEAGQRDFGENKVQELARKSEELPKDIKWHMIGHLQRNKVKYIASFVHLIHGVDSERLLTAINKEGAKNDRVISCLLQVHIASEDTKFGFDKEELIEFLSSSRLSALEHVSIVGLMGMATNTDDKHQVHQEFAKLRELSQALGVKYQFPNLNIQEISMGMSGDYTIALEEGSTMVRIGSSIFGARHYPNQ